MSFSMPQALLESFAVAAEHALVHAPVGAAQQRCACRCSEICKRILVFHGLNFIDVPAILH